MSNAPIEVLNELLGDELINDPTTNRGLTNHLPMALVAKQRLGAGNDELLRFARRYSRNLVPLSSITEELNERSWTRAIGNAQESAALRQYFARRVKDDGVDRTLRHHLPRLWPGLAGAGFHGVIRLAYALDASSSPQIAASLAYFASVARPLRELAATVGRSDDSLALLCEQSASRAWSTPVRARLIDDELRVVASQPGFDEVVSAWEGRGETWAQLDASALAIYASTNDFTALHGVTGLAALSNLRAWMEDEALVSRYAYQALAAAYLSIGAPTLWSSDQVEEFVAAQGTPLDEVRQLAATSDDEHVAKIVYTSITKYHETRRALYTAVAARAVKAEL